MKNHLRRAACVIAVLGLGAAAACGSSDPTAESPDPTSPSSQAPAAAAANSSPPAAADQGDGSADGSAVAESGPAADGTAGAAGEGARSLLPERIREAGVITVGSSLTYPPEQFYEEDGQTPTGFSIDLADAMGEQLGVEFQFVNTTFDAILAGIEARRFDIAITSMSITDERREQVAFVKYFNTGTVITSQGGNPKDIHTMDDLCGLKLAGIKGSLNADKAQRFSDEQCVPNGAPPIDIVWFTDSHSTKQALASGRIDAQFGDFTSSIYNAEHSNGQLEVVSDEIDFSDPYGIALHQGDEDLGRALESALNAVIDSGEYADILAEWGVERGAVDRAEFLAVTR